MTEQEWLAYLDRFRQSELTTDTIADVLDAFLRRVNTVIIGYANRTHADIQRQERRQAAQSERISEVQQTLNHQVDAVHTRIDALEKAVNNDASNAARPSES